MWTNKIFKYRHIKQCQYFPLTRAASAPQPPDANDTLVPSSKVSVRSDGVGADGRCTPSLTPCAGRRVDNLEFTSIHARPRIDIRCEHVQFATPRSGMKCEGKKFSCRSEAIKRTLLARCVANRTLRRRLSPFSANSPSEMEKSMNHGRVPADPSA